MDASNDISRSWRTMPLGALDEPTLARAGLVSILALAAVLETWALTISGYANAYYAEAALAASRNWTAMLTNAADPSGLVSLDKGPLPDWIMGLSGRLFGFSSLSVLLPQALYAVGAVAILYDAVRRAMGRRTALLAALMLALTPVSVLLGRFDDPDALLALLLVASAWAMVRALQSGRLRHVLLCGGLVGLAFNTKLLAAYLVVPGLAVAFLLAARAPLARRIGQLLAGGVVMAGVSLAWFTTMTLIPAGDRPFVTESGDNSWFTLIFATNGLHRLAGYAGTAQDQAGPLRLFSGASAAGQAGWLIPLAVVGLVAGLWLGRHAPRTDLRRAALVLFGLWLLAGWTLFSFSTGIFHSYYAGAIAPPIAGLAAAAVVTLAERAQASAGAAAALAGALALTAVVGFAILGDAPGFVPWLRWVVLAAGVLAACVLLARALSDARASAGRAAPARASGGRASAARGSATQAPARRAPAALAGAVVTAGALLALLAGPAAYSIATVGFGRSGSSPTAGPAALTPPWDRAPPGVFAPALIAYLERNRDGARYLVAATGADFAAPIGLATRAPIITLGGFNGWDPAPTATQLADLVRSGEVRYVLLTLAGGPTAAVGRDRWVAAHCVRVTAPGLLTGVIGENDARLPAEPVPNPQAGGATLGLYRC